MTLTWHTWGMGKWIPFSRNIFWLKSEIPYFHCYNRYIPNSDRSWFNTVYYNMSFRCITFSWLYVTWDILSVFFQLHLSNSAAPEFLLIDEPVANIDELNVLSWLYVTWDISKSSVLFRKKSNRWKSSFRKLNFRRNNCATLRLAVVKKSCLPCEMTNSRKKSIRDNTFNSSIWTTWY